MDDIRPLRAVAVAEAVSYLLLLTATAVKYAADNEIGVKILGPVHGILYLAYAFLTLVVRGERGWSIGKVLLILVLGAVPFGGFYVERRYLAPNPS